jgi:hypothetical protein
VIFYNYGANKHSEGFSVTGFALILLEHWFV